MCEIKCLLKESLHVSPHVSLHVHATNIVKVSNVKIGSHFVTILILLVHRFATTLKWHIMFENEFKNVQVMWVWAHV